MSGAAARVRASGLGGPVLVDLGSTTTTAVTAPAAPRLAQLARRAGQRTMRTVPLDAATARTLGSDFTRVGFLTAPAQRTLGEVRDELGVMWSWDGEAPVPVCHPLDGHPPTDVHRLPRPTWPDSVQVPEFWSAPGSAPGGTSGSAVPAQLAILDPPSPGVLETAFGVRGTWALIEDLAFDSLGAGAVLEWALETVIDAYARALDALPRPPDVILVADDYARSRGMLLSPSDFRAFVKPHLEVLVAYLRARTGALLALHSCGAVGPILRDLADLEPAVLDLDSDADGLDLGTVRRALGGATALHGWGDLGAIGRAAAAGDRDRLRAVLGRLAASAPVIAAPVDAISDPEELLAAVRGSALLGALGAADADWPALARSGGLDDAALADPISAARSARPPAACSVPAAVRRWARPLPPRSQTAPELEPA